MEISAIVNEPAEWSLAAGNDYQDPFGELELDIAIAAPDGRTQLVPAFWAGGREWRVRYAPHCAGSHTWRAVCSRADDSGLHDRAGTLTARPYAGSNPLRVHGGLRVAANRRHLEHRDGTPFFWLADTWWMGLCGRLPWPGDFQWLTADRVRKGFTVVQIVAGLYPDMDAYDERGANEAGFPWEGNWSRIRPAYFDMADERIHWLARSGLVPCIVGCWGYYIHKLGVERMRRHWRYLIARWGAYPVVWCVAGEVLMPYYLEPLPDDAARRDYATRTRAMWNDVAAYIHRVDPYHRPVTAHPSQSARDSLADEVLDFDMLQTGHGDRASLPSTVDGITASYAREPAKPVVNGEVCYEGIGEASRQEVQRLMFWVCMLSGAAGHTYGANGLWQLNGRDRPYGPSPHGMSWGDTPWEEAARLPGSEQVGLARRLLERYRWWQIEPRPEWVEPHRATTNYTLPYAAGVPRHVRLVYLPLYQRLTAVAGMEPDLSYNAFWFDPKNGQQRDIGTAVGDAEGRYRPPAPPIFQDWLLVLEARG
ncbi:MAG: DUF4038 domain-containing protein [Chthonomonadales bacterium]|nr:DUF4038 domain-containing protein [Chthonomonadales bacterium]